MKNCLLPMLLTASLAGVAAAQTCKSYVGQTVAPQSFRQAIAKLPRMTPKGEFETTDQYETRKKSAGNVAPLIISKPLESQNFLDYDADKQKLSVSPSAFSGHGFDARRAAIFSPEFAAFWPNRGMAYDVHVGPEGFTKLEVIFEDVAGRPDYDKYALLPTPKGTSALGTITLSPAEAQRVKPTLKLAFVVIPQAPFVLRAAYPADPKQTYTLKEIRVDATILIADFRCGLVHEPSGKVLGAYTTR